MHTAKLTGQPVAPFDADVLGSWQHQIGEAVRTKVPIVIVGGGTDPRPVSVRTDAAILSTASWSGIVHHDPSEAIVTVRAGTTLEALATDLRRHGQMVPFQPPRYGAGTTIGGAVARGLAGPSRPFAGAVRDAVLGVRIIDGQGRRASFGGAVLKNVAGFDVPRLMTGARGTLGLLTEVTLRLVPIPAAVSTVRLVTTQSEAIERLNFLRGQPLPLSAGGWSKGVLYVRLAGATASVSRAVLAVGGEVIPDAVAREFWDRLRDQRLAAMTPDPGETVWRLSVRADAPAIDAPVVIDWAGWVRWVCVPVDVDLHAWSACNGGIARRVGQTAVPELPPVMARIHRRLRAVFDPAQILNRHIDFGEGTA